MKKEQVLRCQLSAWYPLFKRLTIRSVILPLPQNVIDYLLDDGTLVISGRNEAPSCSHVDDGSDDEQDVQWSDDENVTTLTDAQWIAMNSSLKCNNLSDIFLLLKSSDFVTHDLTQPFLHCTDDSPDPKVDPQLVLRKWCELIPGGEFRCFVKENKLIGVAQRDHTQYYDHVCNQAANILGSLLDFFRNQIQYKFLDEDFVFDAYRDSQGKVWLIDFNPFGEVTDSLLFSWEELTSGQTISKGDLKDPDSPAFRYITSEMTVQPSPYLSYRLPKDFVDLSRGEDAHKLIDFLKLTRSQEPESSDEEG
ncbi:cell division cycle protein 123 homolog isoform X2 [Stegostoma tigrinum]|uniref:cell division cycle protein 123 homolog isoform X2 n=1 Tax=Stegostoma tigrinum TaxID=3053191 RepID=UPI002870325B|nr:cell division cycle protein 123 homolog isoform X2 [Stegostoma tigrinum]